MKRIGDGREWPLLYKAVLLGAALYVGIQLASQITVLLLALLLTVILSLPVTVATDWLEKHHIPRPIGAFATWLAFFAALGGLGALLVPRLRSEVMSLVDQLPALVERLRAQVGGAAGAQAEEAGQEAQSFLQSLLNDPSQLFGPVTNVLTTAFAVAAGVVLVAVSVLYIAANPQPLVDGFVRLFPTPRRNRTREVLARLRHQWLGWLIGTAIDMVLVGILTYLALMAIGLEFALSLAVVAGLLEFVPYLGPIVAGGLATLYALTQSFELAVITLVVFVVIQQIEGNVLVPLIMSRAVRLHPAVVAFGAVIAGLIFGLMGLFVAVPLLAGLIVLIEELWVRPLEGRPEDDGRQPGATPAAGASERA